MVRTQILLDRETYRLLKRAAAARGISLSAMARESIRTLLGGGARGRSRGRRFGFIGCIREDREPVAERHDEHLSRRERW